MTGELLRRSRGSELTEEDCWALYTHVGAGRNDLTAAATAALPDLLRLAASPGGVRVDLVDLVGTLARKAATAPPEAVDPGWPAAWERHRTAAEALLSDPDRAVRYAALGLTPAPAKLLERWRAEEDATVRDLLLSTLTAAAAGTEWEPEVSALLHGLLLDDDPVLRLTAVQAWAAIDPAVPARHVDLMVDVLTDPVNRPVIAVRGTEPGEETAYAFETAVDCSLWLLLKQADDSAAATRFVLGLADRCSGDAEDVVLRRCVLDQAWRLLVERRSAEPFLAPLAAARLDDRDPTVRVRAAHLLAVLGTRSAPYADELAARLDDTGEDEMLEGTVGEHARWALARIGDARALPGLVESLYEPYREQYGRSYTLGDPRRPEIFEVLIPLRAHAPALLPSLRAALRHNAGNGDIAGSLTHEFCKVLEAWGPVSLPALPDVLPLLASARTSLTVADVLVAMGEGAVTAVPALRDCAILDWEANRWKVAWAVWRIGGDPEGNGERTLRLLGEAVLAAEGPLDGGPVHHLADFGPAASAYAPRIRALMVTSQSWWLRLASATALWSITGDPEPTLPVLARFVTEIAEGDDSYGSFHLALEALSRIGRITPEIEAALCTIRARERRLSPYGDYRAVLNDEALRGTIDGLLARAAVGVAGAAVRAEDEVQASGTKQEERPDQPAQGPDQGPDQG
ncbi:HEAT repeat domain-containing protein [Streptomyces sp. NBC_00576]|uniref:HEAT repeat domain-containing protein n=1 Tax=Streptomyces sp. NBC_00576 TaxID=2903665 RepID=UPI002E807308|nr:HEAT repeat domain-containing protein [Streptomyces sp. NBC_00576]WUB72453.1 HEAT repeat domain-containing protein [Streptomyces sp. NBC_00576]